MTDRWPEREEAGAGPVSTRTHVSTLALDLCVVSELTEKTRDLRGIALPERVFWVAPDRAVFFRVQVRRSLLQFLRKPSLLDQKQQQSACFLIDAGIGPRLCPPCPVSSPHPCAFVRSPTDEMLRDSFEPGDLSVELAGGSSVTWAYLSHC